MSRRAYELYQSLFQLPGKPPLERFVARDALYDVVEFSLKFRREGEEMRWNADRYSIWKYKFDPVRDNDFLDGGFECFGELCKETAAEEHFSAFHKRPEETSDPMQYFSFGIEFSTDAARTRLKTYIGYRCSIKPNLPYIVRDELSLAGTIKSTRYDGFPILDPRIPIMLEEAAYILKSAPFFYVVYLESGRLHFKSRPEASYRAAELAGSLFNMNLQPVTTLLENNFQIEVVTFSKAELTARDVKNVTIYFRERNWRKT